MKLDYHVFKSMANAYLGLYVDRARRPTYFDIAETYPALDVVTQAYPVIRREFDQLFAAAGELPQYHEIDSGERKISNTTPKRWNVFMLEILGHRPAANRACCPETCRVLDAVPNLIQAFFSILEPGKSVPEHEGPYLGYLRYHLGLRVPAQNPPKLIVNSQEYVWREGEAVLFDDSWPHSVVNHSNDTRAVLIVDVRRPLPAMPDLFNRFLTDVIGRHTYGRKIARQAEQFAAARGGTFGGRAAA
ncbi:MAG TPA: aspartyl/asparaginyl beta-hydroxylase domain-containing protein [Xanthobacteraceae bacterium]